NPPIDHLRERHVMSLRTLVGARAPLLGEHPRAARLLELESFFVFPSALEDLATRGLVLDATFREDEGLRRACRGLGEAAVAAEAEVLVIDDGAARPSVPAVLAVGVGPPP